MDAAARVAQIEHAAYLASHGLAPTSSAPPTVVYHAKGRKPLKRKTPAVENVAVEVATEPRVSKAAPVRRPPPGLSVGPPARIDKSTSPQERTAYRAHNMPDPVVDETKVDPNTGMGQWVSSESLAVDPPVSPEPEPVSMAPWDADSEEDVPQATTSVTEDKSDEDKRDKIVQPQEEQKSAPIRMQLKKKHRKYAKQ